MEEFGLSEKTLMRIRNFLKAFPEIEEVKIYGSRAKGNYKPGSDIDLAVFGDCEGIIGELLSGLDALPTPYKYDVLDYKTLNSPSLREHIDRVGKTFYKKG